MQVFVLCVFKWAAKHTVNEQHAIEDHKQVMSIPEVFKEWTPNIMKNSRKKRIVRIEGHVTMLGPG